MNDSGTTPSISEWERAAVLACRSPGSPVRCPGCKADHLSSGWHITDLLTREAAVDLVCSSCGIEKQVRIALPSDVPNFFPLERLPRVADAIEEQSARIAERIQKYAATMPAAAFVTHPLWAEARWSATTFQWHPASEAPPIMGIVFDNAEAGLEVFREAERTMNHTDRFEEVRIAIIEGDAPGASGREQRPGYSVRICPDPEGLAAQATMDDLVLDPQIMPLLGQWNRVYPIPGQPALLPRFKREFQKHKEFLLAPVTRRADGQLWCSPELGIIKNHIEFRDLSEIMEDDPDAAALLLPHLITPRTDPTPIIDRGE